MKRLRIYIDTSVIGGCFDKEFEVYSKKLFNLFIKGKYIAVISNLTLAELKDAPENVKKQLQFIPDKNIKLLILTKEAIKLAEKYIDAGVVKREIIADALHIAIATVNKVDAIVSWNFKHLVNLKKIHGFNAVNKKYGYPVMEIRSPQEVI